MGISVMHVKGLFFYFRDVCFDRWLGEEFSEFFPVLFFLPGFLGLFLLNSLRPICFVNTS